MTWTKNDFDGKNINIHHAIESLASKDSMWTLRDNDWSTLYWDSNNTQSQPTLDEIKTEIQRLQIEYEAKEYERKRTRENDGTTEKKYKLQ